MFVKNDDLVSIGIFMVFIRDNVCGDMHICGCHLRPIKVE